MINCWWWWRDLPGNERSLSLFFWVSCASLEMFTPPLPPFIHLPLFSSPFLSLLLSQCSFHSFPDGRPKKPVCFSLIEHILHFLEHQISFLLGQFFILSFSLSSFVRQSKCVCLCSKQPVFLYSFEKSPSFTMSLCVCIISLKNHLFFTSCSFPVPLLCSFYDERQWGEERRPSYVDVSFARRPKRGEKQDHYWCFECLLQMNSGVYKKMREEEDERSSSGEGEELRWKEPEKMREEGRLCVLHTLLNRTSMQERRCLYSFGKWKSLVLYWRLFLLSEWVLMVLERDREILKPWVTSVRIFFYSLLPSLLTLTLSAFKQMTGQEEEVMDSPFMGQCLLRSHSLYPLTSCLYCVCLMLSITSWCYFQLFFNVSFPFSIEFRMFTLTPAPHLQEFYFWSKKRDQVCGSRCDRRRFFLVFKSEKRDCDPLKELRYSFRWSRCAKDSWTTGESVIHFWNHREVVCVGKLGCMDVIPNAKE